MSKKTKSSKSNTEKFMCYFPTLFCVMFIMVMVTVVTKKYNEMKISGASTEKLNEIENI